MDVDVQEVMARQSTLNFARSGAHGAGRSRVSWKHHQLANDISSRFHTVLFGVAGEFTASTQIAAFDLDGTLIRPKSGLKFPRNAADWSLLRRDTKERLNTLIQTGYAIVIISNQNYSGRPAKLEEWQVKMGAIAERVGERGGRNGGI